MLASPSVRRSTGTSSSTTSSSSSTVGCSNWRRLKARSWAVTVAVRSAARWICWTSSRASFSRSVRRSRKAGGGQHDQHLIVGLVRHAPGQAPDGLHLLHLPQVPLDLPAVGHVGQGGHRGHDHALRIADRGGVHAERHGRAVAHDTLHLLAHHAFPSGERPGQGPLAGRVRAAVGVGGRIQDVDHRLLHHRRREPQQPRDRTVDEGDPARRRLHQHHPGRDVVEHARLAQALGVELDPRRALGFRQPQILGDEPRLADLLGQPGDLDRRGRLVGHRGQDGFVHRSPGGLSRTGRRPGARSPRPAR